MEKTKEEWSTVLHWNVSFSGFSNISHFVCKKKDKSSNLIVPGLLSLGGVWSLPVFSVLLFSPSWLGTVSGVTPSTLVTQAYELLRIVSSEARNNLEIMTVRMLQKYQCAYVSTSANGWPASQYRNPVVHWSMISKNIKQEYSKYNL